VIEALQRFFDTLHRSGVRSSPAERLDALRAIECVGLEQRALVKQALRATLVKRAAQRIVFDTEFDRYFVTPRFGRSGKGDRPGASGGAGTRSKKEPRADGGSTRKPRESKPVGRDHLRRALSGIRDGRRERWGRLRQVTVRSTGKQRRAADSATRTRLRDLRVRPDAEQQQALARAVARLVERIRLGAGRRLQRTTRGQPYPRRLFRESLRSDGVPFRLPRRRKRTRTPRVYLLIDVSWSTARAAGLFLQMAAEFVRLGRQTRVVLFVDRPVDATEQVSAWIERGQMDRFAELLRSLPEMNPDARSDYGRTFHRILVSARRPRGRRTVLLILGDGRTNYFDEQAWALAELADGCGAALWLVPEPIESWGTGDSALVSYLPSMDTVVEADDLNGLARGVAGLVRRL
jgi:uncharacterized protein with von Willebrand factor type A (vWA) domain